ncbi:hypothetical protein OG275_38115 (plasmid) [Streptomyces niveus]|uniref:hypothetical protein n=1 Tax=Streptomyces niveus TaxID=193462 RepID=UPI002E33422A|nr:hypothetical protein [Streptomyces niveus]
MTLDLQQKTQRRLRRAVLVLTGIVLLLVALVVAISISGDDDSSGAAGSPAPAASSPEPSPTLTDDGGGYVAPAATVKLPDGAGKSGTLPVSFPRTEEGAAAMAVASTRNAWSWDAAQVRAGILTYASAGTRSQMAASAKDGALGVREFAGLPTSGPVPPGATLAAWPIGVQWTAKGTDTVDLLVLLRVTYAPGEGEETKTQIIVSPTRAVWEADDWKVQPADPPAALPDPVDIGTDAFNVGGWTAIQESDRQ